MNVGQSMAAAMTILALTAHADGTDTKHIPAAARPPAGLGIPSGSPPPFSAAVLAGNTLYVSGVIDSDPATGKLGSTPEESAKFVLDAVKRSVEAGGMTMDNLVWVQVFCADLSNFPIFNKIYATYFHGELPARAFLGVDHLLGNAHYEVMGIAVKNGK